MTRYSGGGPAMVDDMVRSGVPSTEDARRLLAEVTRELAGLVAQVEVQIGFRPGGDGDDD
jgi:hypothetical protein